MESATQACRHGAWSVCGEADHGLVATIEAARKVLFDDPIFGLFAYGGEAVRKGDTIPPPWHQSFPRTTGAPRSLPVAPLIADQRCYGEAPGRLRRGWGGVTVRPGSM